MKRTIVSICILLTSYIILSAQEIEVSGIKYQLSDHGRDYSFEARVMKKSDAPDGEYVGNIIIPEIIENNGKEYKVVSIDSAFQNCKDLVSIKLPNSVKNILPFSFAGCVKLTSIILPDSLNIIGYSAFANCTGLLYVDLPENVKHIRDKAFYGCTNLTSVFIRSPFLGSAVTAFDGCEQLRDVVCHCNPKYILFPIESTLPLALHVQKEYLEDAKNSLMGVCFSRILEFDDYNLGRIYLSCRKLDLSEFFLLREQESCRRLYEEAPNRYSRTMISVQNLLSYTYAFKGEYSKALKEIDKAIDFNPNEPNLYDSKGEILLMKGDKESALKMWRKVQELDPIFLLEMGRESNLYKQLKAEGMITE